MGKEEGLRKKMAKLESMNDQLVAELAYLDRLAKALGFLEGLKTLKEAALDLLAQDKKKFPTLEDETNPPRSN